MVNKDKTGGARQARRREREAQWLAQNWDGASWESLHTALMNEGGMVGGRVVLPASVPTKRAADLPLGAQKIKVLRKRQTANASRWAVILLNRK